MSQMTTNSRPKNPLHSQLKSNLSDGNQVFNFLLAMAACFGVFSVSLVAHGQRSSREEVQVSTTEQIQAARMRIYPGGRDEELLRVQTQLPKPKRNLGSGAGGDDGPPNLDPEEHSE